MKYQSIDFQIHDLKAYDALLLGGYENRNELALLDVENKELILLANLDAFENLMGYGLNPSDFKSFYALSDSKEVLLFPKDLYKKELLSTYKSYLTPDGFDEVLVQEYDVLNVVAVENPDYQAFSTELLSQDSFKIKSLAGILLEGFSTYLLEDENHTLGFHFSNNFIYAYYFNYGKLEFFNVYPATSVENFEKVVLNAISDVLKAEKSFCRCFISGPTAILEKYENSIGESFRFSERIDITEITGDGLVPDELMKNQHELLPVYLYMHHLNI